MKNLFLFVVTLFIFTFVNAQTFVQSENDWTFSKNNSAPTGTLYIQKNFNNNTKWGFSNFLLVTKGWAEITPSLTYSVGKFSFNAGIGIETLKPYYRLTAGTVFIDSLNIVKLFFEKGDGANNYWWHSSYERKVGKFTAGIMSRRFYGSGVSIGYRISKTFLFQVAPLWDHEAKELKTSIFFTYTL